MIYKIENSSKCKVLEIEQIQNDIEQYGVSFMKCVLDEETKHPVVKLISGDSNYTFTLDNGFDWIHFCEVLVTVVPMHTAASKLAKIHASKSIERTNLLIHTFLRMYHIQAVLDASGITKFNAADLWGYYLKDEPGRRSDWQLPKQYMKLSCKDSIVSIIRNYGDYPEMMETA